MIPPPEVLPASFPCSADPFQEGLYHFILNLLLNNFEYDYFVLLTRIVQNCIERGGNGPEMLQKSDISPETFQKRINHHQMLSSLVARDFPKERVQKH